MGNIKRGPGDRLGNWILREHIGGGGNGNVWRVSPADGVGEDRALKLLKKASETNFKRFVAEIGALQRAKAVEGIVPLVDQDLHFRADAGPRWYVMPLAEPAEKTLAGVDAVGVVKAFVPLAKTLAELHALEIHHRDIKPPNLLRLRGRLCFSDFGLVKYPGRADVTPAQHNVGPKFLMAPEMRRDARSAAGGPADVYSFAKTLWVALTGRALGFDGQYVPEGGLGIGPLHPDVFVAPLDELLVRCTDDDPALRPTMDEVEAHLADWVSTMADFHARNLKEWVSVQRRLFPAGFPQRVVWTEFDDIRAVLKLVVGTGNLNHVMLPGGGGMDLTEIALASEAGLLMLRLGTRVVVKPKSFSFESFGPGSPWNYFRLEAEPMPPSGTPGAVVMPDGIDEYVCEISPGTYVTPNAWEYGEYRGQPLPPGARPITRTLKGAFLIVSKRSWYNLAPETYDGRHGPVGGDAFRAYIARHAEKHPEPPPSPVAV
jgi:serine/threonine-protein kinase